MKLEANNEGGLTAKEVFSGLVLETAEGNMLAVCMRDDTIEMQVVGTGRWFRADMDTGMIYEMRCQREALMAPADTETESDLKEQVEQAKAVRDISKFTEAELETEPVTDEEFAEYMKPAPPGAGAANWKPAG
jgi:hypothetical protein